MAIIPTTGPIDMNMIDAEFAKGKNLYAYRGIKWYRPDNTRGYFEGASGNNPPIDFEEFRGKVRTLPITPTGNVGYGNGWFTFPNYNKITVTIQGGSGGTRGSDGYNGCNYTVTGGGAGGQGGTTTFGVYGSASGGGSDTAGNVTVLVFNAETDPNAPKAGVPVLITIGGGGGGGAGGANAVVGQSDGKCYPAPAAARGADGSPGYLTIRVE